MIPQTYHGIGLYAALVAFVLLAAVACAEIPPYNPPPASIPDGWRNRCISPADLRLTTADGVALSPAEFVESRSLNDKNWKFSGVANSDTTGDEGLNPASYQPGFDDGTWESIAVPLNWYVQYPDAYRSPDWFKGPYFKGVYRRRIQLSEADLQKRVVLHFGVIGYEATLYVNGQPAGNHHGDFVPWDVDITHWVHAGENVLAIRVVSDFTTNPAIHTYGSNWARTNIKAGLWQEAYLTLTPQIRFTRVRVTPKLNKGGVEIDADILNPASLQGEFRPGVILSPAWKADAKKTAAAVELEPVKFSSETNTFHTFVKLNQPILWRLENPYLYYLTLYLRDAEGKIVSALPVRFGYREFKARGRNFYLNGERIFLFGENWPVFIHGGLGKDPVVETKEIADDLQNYKAYGYNILRTAHMPEMPVLYDLADELGIMVFDEWSWAFTSNIQEDEFARRNDQELTEFVYRDYNHPSVVMWSGGNEVPHSTSAAVKRQLDRQVDLIHALDRTGRPVSSFSGSASQLAYGLEKLNTDVVDLHNYLGMASHPWTKWNSFFENDYRRLALTYAPTEKEFQKPWIIWECVGFTWGWHRNDAFQQNDVKQYADYVAKEELSDWGEHFGIGLAGSLGLHTALTKGVYVGRGPYGRRILGLIRQNPDVQGFAPWFQAPSLPEATVWNQPVYSGLRNEAYLTPRNMFWGRKNTYTLFVVNSTNREFQDIRASISLVRQDGSETVLSETTFPAIAPWRKYNKSVEVTLPVESTSQHAQLRLTLRDGEKTVSQNYYEIFAQTPEIMVQPISSAKATGILNRGLPSQVNKVTSILKSLGVEAKIINPTKGPFDQFAVLILPPAAGGELNSSALLDWVRNGGRLLILEQGEGKLPVLEGYSLIPPERTFVDLVIPEHPMFRGLNQDCFDTWEDDAYGFPVEISITPFSLNAVAVRGPLLARKGVGMAIMEATLDKGRIVASQLNATRLWGKDSAATTYLVNLLNYLIGSGPMYPKAQPLVQPSDRAEVSDDAKLTPINLKPYANRDFADRSGEGGPEGWTGQGAENDFRTMPLGRQMVGKIPFDIIDPAKNHNRAALILRGSHCPKLPAKITSIKIGGKYKRLFFLHGIGWNAGGEAGRYRFHYQDGQTCDFVLMEGKNIGDWWSVSDLPDAWPGITATNGLGQNIGLFVAAWTNPRPDVTIVSMDFLSVGSDETINYSSASSCIPFLVAVTGEP